MSKYDHIIKWAIYMLRSIQQAIENIDIIINSFTVTPEKAGIMRGLRSQLIKFRQEQDINLDTLENLRLLVSSLQNNPILTYKRISLFGYLISDSLKYLIELNELLTSNQHLLAIEKINNKSLQDEIKRRNYTAAKAIIDQLNDSAALRTLDNWLANRQKERVNLPANKYKYPSLLYPIFEIDSTQQTFTLEEVLHIVINRPENKNTAFTYAIDLNGNLIFSRGANSSFHYNLCQGADVYGAGEVHLHHQGDNVILDIVNNRSGLYKPRTEFLAAVKQSFKNAGVQIQHTKLNDEAKDFINVRMRTY